MSGGDNLPDIQRIVEEQKRTVSEISRAADLLRDAEVDRLKFRTMEEQQAETLS